MTPPLTPNDLKTADLIADLIEQCALTGSGLNPPGVARLIRRLIVNAHLLAAQDETLETLRRRNAELAGALERLRAAMKAIAESAGEHSNPLAMADEIDEVLASASRPTEAPK